MSAVPDYITRQENAWWDRQESYEARLEKTEQHLTEQVLDHIKAGRDALLPLGSRAYPLSSFLGECSESARAILFGACHLALKGAPAEAVNEAVMLFARTVAGEYANDNAPDLVGDE